MLTIIGLILNFIGSVLIAVSFGRYPEGYAPNTRTKDESGKIIRTSYVAHFNYPHLFRFGLVALAIGFLLQLPQLINQRVRNEQQQILIKCDNGFSYLREEVIKKYDTFLPYSAPGRTKATMQDFFLRDLCSDGIVGSGFIPDDSNYTIEKVNK